MLSVDVLIVGGGPAGSSLGYMTQKAGLKSCIVDKALFPRKKLCGGLLTQKTHDLINLIYNDTSYPCECITSKIGLFLGDEKLSSVQVDSNFYLVDRKDFDQYLIMKYQSAAGVFLENTTVTSVNLRNNCASLSTGEVIYYRILVGADGANSQVRRYIDRNYRPNAVCLEFDSPSDDVSDELQVYFLAVRSGYGWCFPKKSHYTVGLGGVIEDNQNIKNKFEVFYKNIGKIDGNENTKGALIPFGRFVKSPCKNNILLIGDAAGLVDPITGEGIYFALLSAKYASEAIISFTSCKDNLRKLYSVKVKQIHSIISEANTFNSILFNGFAKSYLLKMVKGKTNVIKYYSDNLLSHYNITYLGFVTKYLKVRWKRKKSERKRS